MSDSLKISVVVCTHNGSRYVLKQLESVLGQTRKPEEIIIADDCSTDNTLDVIIGFIQGREEFRSGKITSKVLTSSQNIGVVANFSRALKEAQCELIALCDQDDVWHPEKLQVLERRLQISDNALAAYSNSQLVDGELNSLTMTGFDALRITASEKMKMRTGLISEVLERRNVVTGATLMIRRKLLDEALPIPNYWLHDEWLALVASYCGEVVLIDDCLVDYRQHGDNLVGLKRLTMRHAIAKILYPRRERNKILLERAEARAKHRYFVGGKDRATRASFEHLLHERNRSLYPEKRLKRIAYVIREFQSGRYQAYGLGLADVIRDLVQPA